MDVVLTAAGLLKRREANSVDVKYVKKNIEHCTTEMQNEGREQICPQIKCGINGYILGYIRD